MKTTLFSLILALSAPFAHAQSLRSCSDANIGLTDLMSPPAQNSKTYSKNSITVYNIDTEEPAAASAGLAIVLPDNSNPVGGAKCYAVTGLSEVNVMNAVSSYDAAKGLLLTVPAKTNIDGNSPKSSVLRIRINQQSSTVILE